MKSLGYEFPADERISRGLGISLAVHGILLSFFVIKTAFFTPEAIDFSQAVRVDIVGLPDKMKPEDLTPAREAAKPALPEKRAQEVAPKPLEKNLPKPVTQKDPEAVNIDKAKQQKALEKLKALAALEKIKQDVEEEKKAPPATGKSETSGQVIKGNQISPGTALSGLSKLQHETYIADLDRHIKQHWALPEWLSKRDLKAQVRVYINGQGLVIARKIVKSSGNPNYDDEVLATIDRSVPFPQPPDRFLALVETDGILIGFPE